MKERMRPRRKSANMLASSNRQTETPSPLGAGVFYWSPQDACGQRRYGLYTTSKKASQPHFAEGRIRRSPSLIPYRAAPFRRYSPLNRDGRRSLSNNAGRGQSAGIEQTQEKSGFLLLVPFRASRLFPDAFFLKIF